MQSYDINAPLAQIKEALGDKLQTIDEADLSAELQKYLEYGVPPEQAVKTILRHHGVQAGGVAPVSAPAAASGEPTKLADIPGNVPAVNLIARVISLNTKTVQARGEDKQIVWGMLGDDTATRAYTSWRPMEGVEKGDVLKIQGAYTKEWRSEVQINFGDRTVFEKAEQSELPATPEVFRDVPIGELNAGLRGIRVTGRILDISSRQVNVQGEPKTIYGGTIADETGKVEFTAWSDPGIKADQVVTIEGGYVRAYRGVPQFNFDSDAKISPAEVEMPEAAALNVATAVPLCDLIERGGNDVTVIATLLEVRDGSGLVFRDPETNRVVHGAQINDQSVPDLRIKAVLDDGTAAMSMIANKDITVQLLGKTLEECQEMAKNAFRSEVVQERLHEKLAGRVYQVSGNVLVDEYGAMFIARTVTPYAGETGEAAQALLDALDNAGETPAPTTGGGF